MLFFAIGALAEYGFRISNRKFGGVICRWASDSRYLRLWVGGVRLNGVGY